MSKARSVLAQLAVAVLIVGHGGIGAEGDGGTASASLLPAASPFPPRPAPTDPWTAALNWERSLGGATDGSAYPLITNLPADNVGPQNHVDYLVAAQVAGFDYCGHGEAPGYPKTIGVNYVHNVLFCGPKTLAGAIQGWAETPYHGPPILAPTVTRVGAGHAEADTFHANAAVTAASSPIAKTYVWPKNGGALPRTTMTIGESPDPTAVCPPITGQRPGQPVYAYFPASRKYVSATVTDPAGDVPFCMLGLNPGSAASRFTVFTKRPWTVGALNTVSIVTTAADGSDQQILTWTFNAYAPPAAPNAYAVPIPGGATITYVDNSNTGGLPLTARTVRLTPQDANSTVAPITITVSAAGTWSAPIPAGQWKVCGTATNEVGTAGCTGWSGLNVTAAPTSGAIFAAGFLPVDPFRLVDTRATGPMLPNTVFELDVRTHMPVGAVAVALNLTATRSAGDGYVTAYACNSAIPATSNLNFVRVGDTTNAGVIPVGDGRVCFRSSQQTDIIVDISGWMTPSAPNGFTSLAGMRLVDTRSGQGSSTLLAGQTIAVQVADAGAPTAAVALNVTAVAPSADGFITVWPCGTAQPNVSNLNPTRGITRPNAVNVRVGAAGKVCIYSQQATDLLVDLVGEYRSDSAARYAPLTPTRIFDSRAATYVPWRTITENYARLGVGVVGAALVNLTSTTATQAGFLSAVPCPTGALATPVVSAVNYVPGVDTANSALAPTVAGAVCVYAAGRTALIVDLFGAWSLP